MTKVAAVVAALVVVGCGSDDDTDDPAAPSSSPSTSASGTAAETTEQATSTPPPPAEVVTAGPVTILTNEYGLPDTTGWDTVAVFDLTNTGEYVTAVPYRVTVSSADGATTAASDGSDAVILSPGETVTVVEDDLDPTGPSPPSQGEVTVYGPASGPAAGLVGEPEWASSNELFDCNNGLVGCGMTGDLTYDGPAMASLGALQIVAYRGEEIVAAGSTVSEQSDVTPGQVIPYSGQIASASGFDGTGVTDVSVRVEQISEGD